MYGSYHRIVNASKMDAQKESVAVAGNICESGDVFTGNGPDATRMVVNPVIGDCIAILDAGAYGMSMGSQYNLRELPAEILVKDKDFEIIRRRQEFKDLVLNFNWFNE